MVILYLIANVNLYVSIYAVFVFLGYLTQCEFSSSFISFPANGAWTYFRIFNSIPFNFVFVLIPCNFCCSISVVQLKIMADNTSRYFLASLGIFWFSI